MSTHPSLSRGGACAVLASLLLVLAVNTVHAKKPTREFTLIQLSDTHGTLVPHGCVIAEPDGTERYSNDCGGVAKLKTLVNEIRAEQSENLLIAVGDTVHGSAEVMFTVGDAIMPALNAFGIDAYVPGNWEFGYGPAVFRNRFTEIGPGRPKPSLPANIQVMSAYVSCDDVPVIEDVTDVPGFCQEITATQPVPSAHGVIRANFPTLAANLYNVAPPLPNPLHNTRVLPPYKIFEVGGTRVAVIGLTAAIVPQQPDVFNVGLRFTAGTEELPGLINEIHAEGVEIIVVASELGLSQNVQIARDFEDVDIVLSGHTHEVTLGALLANKDTVVAVDPVTGLTAEQEGMLRHGAAIVVEASEDAFLGRLDLTLAGDNIVDFVWQAIPADDSVDPDPVMQQLVDAAEAPFIDGDDFIRHTFMPGGYCDPGAAPTQAAIDLKCGDAAQREMRGLQLVDSLDTVVGSTEVLLHRHSSLEDVWNNFIADAVREVTDPVVVGEGTWTGVDLSMTNGFRFGIDILSPTECTDDEIDAGCGQIKLRDLYSHFPISPAVAVAEFSGVSIEKGLEEVLSAVFNRNPYLQRGGWYLGLSNMTQKIDLDNRPFSSSGGRIVETRIGTAGGLEGETMDPSKRYVFASCFPHGNPLDQICRTTGGAGHKFFQLSDADDYNSTITMVDPVNEMNITTVNPFPPPPPGVVIKQVAPDAYLHPVHVLRRYLDMIGGVVREEPYATGRIQTVDSTTAGNPPVDPPVSAVDPTLIQPIQGAGPILLPKSAPLP